MPRHGMKGPEKVKDFKGTLIRIFKSLEKWKYVLVLSCVLAMFASILSTVAPNKLADVTDVISESIKPNVEAMKDISESISKNIASCYRTSNPSSLFIEFNKLSKSIGFNLPKGSGPKVDEIGKEIVNKYGKEKLESIAKLNFKNTEKILSE